MGQKSSPWSTCHVLSRSCSNRTLSFLRWRWQKKKQMFTLVLVKHELSVAAAAPSLGLREFVLSQRITFFSAQTKTLISPRGRSASRLHTGGGEKKKKEVPPFIRVIAVVENFSNIVSFAPFAVKELQYKFRLCKKRHMGQKPRGIQGLVFNTNRLFHDLASPVWQIYSYWPEVCVGSC